MLTSTNMADIEVYLLTHILPGLIGYLIGSIPFGLIVTRFAGLGDIRSIGSGNIGTTNVLRTGNKKIAALTLLLDLSKGLLAAWVAAIPGSESVFNSSYINIPFSHNMVFISCAMALVGHMFPIWLKFKGGKGVATYIGILLALHWWLAIAFLVTWIAVFVTSRISSLSAITAVTLTPLYGYLMFASSPLLIFTLIAGVLILFRHKDNIRRLMKGEEGKIKL